MLILETNKISLKPGTSLVVYMKIRALYSRYMFVCICVWKSYSVVLRGWKKPAGRVQGKSFWVGRDSAGHRWHWSGTGGCCRRWCSGGGMCHLRCSSNLFHGHNRAELVGMPHWVRFLRAEPCSFGWESKRKGCVCVPTAEQCVKTMSPSHTGQEKGKTRAAMMLHGSWDSSCGHASQTVVLKGCSVS